MLGMANDRTNACMNEYLGEQLEILGIYLFLHSIHLEKRIREERSGAFIPSYEIFMSDL